MEPLRPELVRRVKHHFSIAERCVTMMGTLPRVACGSDVVGYTIAPGLMLRARPSGEPAGLLHILAFAVAVGVANIELFVAFDR